MAASRTLALYAWYYAMAFVAYYWLRGDLHPALAAPLILLLLAGRIAAGRRLALPAPADMDAAAPALTPDTHARTSD
jgi:hypothetical protein